MESTGKERTRLLAKKASCPSTYHSSFCTIKSKVARFMRVSLNNSGESCGSKEENSGSMALLGPVICSCRGKGSKFLNERRVAVNVSQSGVALGSANTSLAK